MEYFPGTLTSDESDALSRRIADHFDVHDFGLWAVQIKDICQFAGFIGLSIPQFDAHFTPCVEIGWRLAASYWGRGYATEGALKVLDFAFDIARLDEVVSMTAVGNLRSRRVMERIGMTYLPADEFDHPMLPLNHTLRRHVLYRMSIRADNGICG